VVVVRTGNPPRRPARDNAGTYRLTLSVLAVRIIAAESKSALVRPVTAPESPAFRPRAAPRHALGAAGAASVYQPMLRRAFREPEGWLDGLPSDGRLELRLGLALRHQRDALFAKIQLPGERIVPTTESFRYATMGNHERYVTAGDVKGTHPYRSSR
jgi:hypothetical protein